MKGSHRSTHKSVEMTAIHIYCGICGSGGVEPDATRFPCAPRGGAVSSGRGEEEWGNCVYSAARHLDRRRAAHGIRQRNE